MTTTSTLTEQTENNSINMQAQGKVFPLQARCGPEGGYRYSSTLP